MQKVERATGGVACAFVPIRPYGSTSRQRVFLSILRAGYNRSSKNVSLIRADGTQHDLFKPISSLSETITFDITAVIVVPEPSTERRLCFQDCFYVFFKDLCVLFCLVLCCLRSRNHSPATTVGFRRTCRPQADSLKLPRGTLQILEPELVAEDFMTSPVLSRQPNVTLSQVQNSIGRSTRGNTKSSGFVIGSHVVDRTTIIFSGRPLCVVDGQRLYFSASMCCICSIPLVLSCWISF